jgi:hypothetical protein
MKAGRNPCLQAALDGLARVGIHHPAIARGGKHVQVRWTSRSGSLRVFHVALTPSDWRAPENVKHDIRRILREDAMLIEPEPRAPVRELSRLEKIEQRLRAIEQRLGIIT